MTGKPTSGDRTPHAEKDVERQAKGSVHEAIGKLIGDDAARDCGAAEKRAGAGTASSGTPQS